MKYLLFAAISAGLTLTAFSQKKAMSMATRYGALLGITGSTIGGESDSYNSLLIGGQGGFLLSIDPGVPDHIVWQVEANVSMQGAKYTDPGVSGKVQTTYVNLPIVIQNKMSSGFFGEAGLQPGFLVSAKDKYNGRTDDYKDYVNTFDLSVPLGLGFHFSKIVAINLRYMFGLSNINKTGTDKDHNRVWAFRLLWFFK